MSEDTKFFFYFIFKFDSDETDDIQVDLPPTADGEATRRLSGSLGTSQVRGRFMVWHNKTGGVWGQWGQRQGVTGSFTGDGQTQVGICRKGLETTIYLTDPVYPGLFKEHYYLLIK